MAKTPSKRKGDVVNGIVYSRMFDFSRYDTYNLVRIMISWSSDPIRMKYVAEIKSKIEKRIQAGKCSQEDVDFIIAELTRRKMKRVSRKS